MARVRPADLGVGFAGDGRLVLRAPMRGLATLAPPFAIELLAFCSQPRTAEDVEGRYGPQARQLFEDMAEIGLLVDPGEALATPEFFANYAALDVHRRMLADRPRVDAYARAIAATVQPGMAVLDAGTGTGLLAALAALAGARVVYAVDNSDILDVAAEVFTATGVADRARPLRGDLRTVELPEKVDVLLTETFGAFGLTEDGLRDVAACAARNLAPGGRLVPGRVGLWLAPVADPEALHAAVGAFGRPHGVDLTPLRQRAWHRALTRALDPGVLAAAGVPFAELVVGEVAQPHGRAVFELPDVEVTGFAGWFALDMGEFWFSTAPDAPLTHWQQQYLPVEPLRGAGRLDVGISFAVPLDDRRGLEVTLELEWDGERRRTWHRLR